MSEPTHEPSIAEKAYAAILALGLVPKGEREVGFLRKAIMLDCIFNEPGRQIEIARAIAGAGAEGWQAANHAWQDWLEANIPDWDAMAGIDLTTLPKEPK